MIDGFVFYRSFLNAVKLLPQDEQLDFLFALCAFALDEKAPDLKGDMQKAMFELMRPNITASVGRYLTSVENGKKGGAPKGNQNARKQPKKQPKTTQENNLKQPSQNNLKQPEKTTQNNLNINIKKNINNTDTSEGFETLSDEPVEAAKERLLQTLENMKAEQQKKEAEEYRAAAERETARKQAIEDAINSMREASGGDTA